VVSCACATTGLTNLTMLTFAAAESTTISFTAPAPTGSSTVKTASGSPFIVSLPTFLSLISGGFVPLLLHR
jgi:hypothetical protein